MSSAPFELDAIERQACAVAVAGRRAINEALLQHKRAGNPIAIWQNGQVRWIPADEINVDETAH
jgi:hypothetical protein